MGIYLNPASALDAYLREANSPYFVDKSLILEELLPRISTNMNYICITRPRRFGKTVMANLIASFFQRKTGEVTVFDSLKIASSEQYGYPADQYDVIFISLNELPRKCRNYGQYIDRIEERLLTDLLKACPEAGIRMEDAVWDALSSVYNVRRRPFVFILDEWDYIFHRDFVTEEDKKDYIDFLSNLLKGKAYVALAYMTGILPIAKYSSGSELNMFLEYSMASEEMFSDFFGFTDAEVDELYAKYLTCQKNPAVTREGLKLWYDGYHTKHGDRVYNPRSVIAALTNNNLGNYWTSSGPYDEIFYYIKHNIDEVRDALAYMVSGFPVAARIREYAATSMNLTTKDEIFSAMVVYGFLSYENGTVCIPNKELMERFRDMLVKESSLGYVYQLARASSRMLKATLAGDTDTMIQILEFAHNTESPLFHYSSEAELTALVNLVYLSARDSYRIEREDKAGVGYADFIFYPESDRRADAIILELKVNHTAEEALQQIRDRKYAWKLERRLGEISRYKGRILGVGIAYDKETKVHSCKVEVLRERSLI